MTDNELLAAQASHLLLDKARRTIERRRWTDKPGADWGVNEVGQPQYFGAYNKAVMSTSDDGTKYAVHVYNRAGDLILSGEWKGLDAAFRNGRMYANSNYGREASNQS